MSDNTAVPMADDGWLVGRNSCSGKGFASCSSEVATMQPSLRLYLLHRGNYGKLFRVHMGYLHGYHRGPRVGSGVFTGPSIWRDECVSHPAND